MRQISRHPRGVQAIRVNHLLLGARLVSDKGHDRIEDRLAVGEALDAQTISQVIVGQLPEVLELDLVLLEGVGECVQLVIGQPGANVHRLTPFTALCLSRTYITRGEEGRE